MLPRILIGSVIGATLGGAIAYGLNAKIVTKKATPQAIPLSSPTELSSAGEDALAAFETFSKLPEYGKLKQIFIELEALEKSTLEEEKAKTLTSEKRNELKMRASRYINKANQYFDVFIAKRKGDSMPIDLVEDVTQAREYLSKMLHNIYQATSTS